MARTKKKLSSPDIPRQQIVRISPDPSIGLTPEQVHIRVHQGWANGDSSIKSKSERQIILENTFTFFNILNSLLALAVIMVGSFRNVLFMGVVISNTVIGAFQSIRAKRTIDKLSLISAPKAMVMRGGQKISVSVPNIVIDDILVLSAGNQICSDSVVVQGECEVNESLITGESDPVLKKVGDKLLSGSFVSSGFCHGRVEHVGSDNYAAKIAGDAKYMKKRSSEIMNSIELLIKVIGFTIIPVGALLFYKEFAVLGVGLQDSVVRTVAALVGMVPEGVVLLTSVVFAISIIRLSRYKTLVQDLYCIETLARVDTLCLDKTGTITEGTMQVEEMLPLNGYNKEIMELSLAALAHTLPDNNPTFMAILDYFPNPGDWVAAEHIPFSSARKWSGAFFPGYGCYVMGAGEFILGDRFSQIAPLVENYSSTGRRVLLLAKSDKPFNNKNLPDDLSCVGLVLITDKIRREAPRTLRYFADQGVDLKIISGDNPVTVSCIASKAGLETAHMYIDAGTLHTYDDISDAVKKYSVFGRVTPHQKLQFVQALKADGHTVAMTGDGVNDVLALKEADCSIAMASGSDAARTVSTLVLLDSNFSSMPVIVQEGRRSINNLQRSSSLFLVKTIFSALLSILFVFIGYSFPFIPIQLTMISAMTIGCPSFILALEPNKERLKGRFLINVIKTSLPAALTMTTSVVLVTFLGNAMELTGEQISTLSVIVTSIAGLLMLFKVCVPFNVLRAVLFLAMTSAICICIIFFADIFMFTAITLPMLMVLIPMLIFSITMMLMLLHFVDNFLRRLPTPRIKKFRFGKSAARK